MEITNIREATPQERLYAEPQVSQLEFESGLSGHMEANDGIHKEGTNPGFDALWFNVPDIPEIFRAEFTVEGNEMVIIGKTVPSAVASEPEKSRLVNEIFVYFKRSFDRHLEESSKGIVIPTTPPLIIPDGGEIKIKYNDGRPDAIKCARYVDEAHLILMDDTDDLSKRLSSQQVFHNRQFAEKIEENGWEVKLYEG